MYRKFIKRFLDFILSLIALIILSPILLIIYILVRIKLGKPAIFKQERPGKNEKIFTLYKFRTMTDEKDKDGNLLPDEKRLTKFGKILRSTSLDELPELVNILKGDMSIVGPRPLLVRYLPYYTEEERHRHDVRPGLTGLAQIHGRNTTNWTDRFKYDVEYTHKITFLGDLKILFKTIMKVIKKEDILVGKEQILLNLDEERKMNEIELKEFDIETVNKYKEEIKLYLKDVLDENGISNDNNRIEKIMGEMKQFIEDKSAIIIGAFQKEKLLGFIWGYKTSTNDKNRIHINYFVVDEKCRKQGIGSQLIEKIYEIAKEMQIQEVELMVTTKNATAVNFYKKQGFEEERVKLCKRI